MDLMNMSFNIRCIQYGGKSFMRPEMRNCCKVFAESQKVLLMRNNNTTYDNNIFYL